MTATLTERVRLWRAALESTGDVGPDDADELEAHLIDEIAALGASGLTESEALIIATRRIGETHHLSREYFKVNVNRLWKRLAVPDPEAHVGHESWLAGALALLAAVLAQVPFLFGGSYFGEGMEIWGTFASVWIVPSLVAWFAWRHGIRGLRLAGTLGALAAIHLFAALVPFAPESSTRILVMLHIPFLTWLLLLPLALDQAWRSLAGRIHYLRLTAEAFLYSVLLGLGAIALVGITLAIFGSAGLEIEDLLVRHGVIAALFGVPVLGVILADRKRQVIENFAPILARVFVPLFALSIGAFLVTIVILGVRPSGDRDLLIVVNGLLLLVVAMLFYDVSAREESGTRGVSDIANVALLLVTVILDAVALQAIFARLAEFGASPNRIAVLGLNSLLFVHLLIVLITYLRYIGGRVRFRGIEQSVVRLLPLYGAWLLAVVVVFPLAFGGA